jgi:hypothetical protein
VKREIYDECHSALDDMDSPLRCCECERIMDPWDEAFAYRDAEGMAVVCETCLKKKSIRDLAAMFGKELTMIADLEDER